MKYIIKHKSYSFSISIPTHTYQIPEQRILSSSSVSIDQRFKKCKKRNSRNNKLK